MRNLDLWKLFRKLCHEIYRMAFGTSRYLYFLTRESILNIVDENLKWTWKNKIGRMKMKEWEWKNGNDRIEMEKWKFENENRIMEVVE